MLDQDIKKEVYLVGELFLQLLNKYNRVENKKHLYKDMDDLTLIEINTLLVIGCEPQGKSMSQIANTLGVSFGTPTVTIDRLITKGYVERIRDEEDRRQVFVKLSPKGQEVHLSIRALKDRVIEQIFGILDEEERKQLIHLLSKILNEVDSLFAKLK